MESFLIVTREPLSSAAIERLKAEYPDHRAIAANAIVVRTSTLSQEISTTLFPRQEGKTDSHVVVRFDAYWGFHEQALWEWLTAKPANGA